MKCYIYSKVELTSDQGGANTLCQKGSSRNVIHHNWVRCMWKVSKFEEDCCPSESSGRCNCTFIISTLFVIDLLCKAL